MAHFDNRKPTRPRRVTFPICDDEQQWNEAVRSWIGEVHPEFQDRLRLLQPFTFAPGRPTLLSVLHDLDVQDKHRDLLTVSADLHQVHLGGSFEYEDQDVRAVPRVDMRSDVKFGDGTVLGTVHAGAPIRMLGQMILRPVMRIQLTHRDSTHDVMPLLQQIVAETRRYLDILLFGVAPPDEAGGAEWRPMDVGPPSE